MNDNEYSEETMHQLYRYGLPTRSVIDVIWALTDVNDDLQHGRSVAVTLASLKTVENAVEELKKQIAGEEYRVNPLDGKYGNVLRPFVEMMEKELHANAGKGDRPGWLQMDRKTSLLEIFYHLAKLQKATKDNDIDGIREYAADVANMAMMHVDVCGRLIDEKPSECNHPRAHGNPDNAYTFICDTCGKEIV